MTKIKVLDINLANKIAAGEVIEQTSSVVKELVENSIDASSSKIEVNLINGGLKEITVIDNGIGMNKEDALLSFKRHATSKISKSDDLFFINSLGFRGEALPSIASVSKVELITNNNELGTKIVVDNGKLIEDVDFNTNVGTKIKVNDLFLKTPARLKFLKNESTELFNTTRLIEKLSLANPDISFTLTNNDKVIIKTSGSDNLHKTIHEIYGLEISKNMLEINNENNDFIIKGYISKPTITRSNRNHFHTFINDRVIRNFDINKSINDAYYTYKPSDKFPIVVINIYIDSTLIDVNIHPTKQDIKLSKLKELKDFLYESIKDTLYSNLLIPSVQYETKLTDKSSVDYDQVSLDFSVPTKETLIINEEIKKTVIYPIGLVHGTYIVGENEEGMYLIDQHAAAERINYELYKKALKDEVLLIKEMLIPITLELSKSEYDTFLKKKDHFSKLGFSFKEFGINTILVNKHPHYLKEGNEEESVRKIVDLIINLEDFQKGKYEENIAITLACKMSVKGNTAISTLEQEYLLNELMQCDNPYTCPHGRPTIIKFTTYELEKMFKRAK